MCGLRRIVGSDNFCRGSLGVISDCGGLAVGIVVLKQAACLVVGSVAVGGFAFLLGCEPLGRAWGSVAGQAWMLVCW